MIEKQLRSQSIRFKYSDGILHPIGNKYYYNFTKDSCSTNIIKILSPFGVNNVFEYSVNSTDNVVGYTFHLTEYGRDSLLKPLSHDYISLFDVLSNILGSSFSNYSGGIKIDGDLKCGYKFYFYPIYYTNGGKMKVTGLNNATNCHLLFKKISSIIQLSHSFEDEYNQFSRLCVELRGVGLCVDKEEYCYNIYVKCSHKQLATFLNMYDSDLLPSKSILVSMKICHHEISGYNVYYAGEFGIPCCGWGEVLD